MNVLFPLPTEPTIAINSFSLTSKDIFFKTLFPFGKI